MSRYRYWWYDYVKKAVIHSINSTEAPQSVQEAMAQIAVKKTLAETEQLHRGPERLQLVDIVYRQRKHSIPGAAMALFVSEGTARDWNRQFIYRVAGIHGFSVSPPQQRPGPHSLGRFLCKKAGHRSDPPALRELGGATLPHLLTRATAARSVL